MFFDCSFLIQEEAARRPVSRVLSAPKSAVDDHSSGTPVAGRLARPTRTAARKRAWPCGLPSLLGLAPGGVCRAAAVTGGAVRSYRTLSPLPPALAGSAVCFLWHCPWGRPRRALPGTVLPWSPDFPPCACRQAKSGHPAVWHPEIGAGLWPCQ